MRRFLTLVSLLCLAVPAGISISGCTRNPAGNYCNGLGYGLKNTQVSYILLQPEVTGISLAYGQTLQSQSPTAYTCKQTAAVVGQKSYDWGSSNRQLVDISPVGNLCAGTWNRNTGGGIADYTYCYAPNPLPNTNGLPYGVAYITATALSVSSNPVAVYVHAPVTSISLVGPAECQSQGTVAQLDSEACYVNNGTQYEFCAPASVSPANYACPGKLAPGISSVPTCESSIGTMSYSVANGSIASLSATTNQITAEQPGTTAITASIAQSGSSAGYFSTCPPESISVTLANGATSGTIAQGQTEGLTTTVLDTRGQTITGLSLSYQSTDPIDITVGTNGSVSTTFPGTGAINAICQPSTCNPAPINEIGLNGTGVSISSNPVALTVPGTAADYAWFGAPGNSQYVVPVQLLTGAVGSSIRLPYVPNSMMMDRSGNSLYFGSARELMTISTSSNAVSTQNASVPGVVLAVSPTNTQVLVNDQARHLFYLSPSAGGNPITFGGMGAAAQWTPDGQTLYIYDNSQLNTPASCGTVANPITGHTDTLYIYNANTGWTVEPLPASPLPKGAQTSCFATPNTAMPVMQQTPAVMIPGVGAYFSGDPTTAHTWCPTGTVGNNASVQFYPQGDSQAVQSDIVNTTLDGAHILGAIANAGGSITINDILDPIPSGLTQSNGISTPQDCSVTTNSATGVQTMNPLLINDGGGKSDYTQTSITDVDASAANQVVVGSIPQKNSAQTVAANIAFITYEPASTTATTNAVLPYYLPANSGPGIAGSVKLNVSSTCASCGVITAPLTGAFTPDHTLFFVSTEGDNEIHYISVTPSVSATTPPTDTQQISPNIPACTPPSAGGLDVGCMYTGSGAIVPATAIYVKPRATT
jgi:trimeric autotransporter adhesin